MAWATVYAAWGLSKPHSISNMLEAGSIPKNYKPIVLVGAVVLCWSVWLCRNAVVFENKHSSFFAGIILDYALTLYLGYPSTVYVPGGACCGISVLGAGGQGVFYPDTWMAA